MQIFFATIGATANIGVVLTVGPWLFVFAVITLSVHLVIVLTLGKIAGISLPDILVASNANMGGPDNSRSNGRGPQVGIIGRPRDPMWHIRLCGCDVSGSIGREPVTEPLIYGTIGRIAVLCPRSTLTYLCDKPRASLRDALHCIPLSP